MDEKPQDIDRKYIEWRNSRRLDEKTAADMIRRICNGMVGTDTHGAECPIPAVASVAVHFSTSKSTVERAYKLIEDLGLIARRQEHGRYYVVKSAIPKGQVGVGQS